MSTTPHDEDQPWQSSTHRAGRTIGLVLAILGFLPTAWIGMLSFGFWSDGGDDRAISGFTDGPGLACLVLAGVLLLTIVGLLRSMSRD